MKEAIIIMDIDYKIANLKLGKIYVDNNADKTARTLQMRVNALIVLKGNKTCQVRRYRLKIITYRVSRAKEVLGWTRKLLMFIGFGYKWILVAMAHSNNI